MKPSRNPFCVIKSTSLPVNSTAQVGGFRNGVTTSRTSLPLACLLSLSAITLFATSSYGQTTRTWNGTGGTTWNTAGSWTGGIPDTITEVALFSAITANDPASFGTAITIGGFSLTGGEARNLIFTNTIALDQYGVDNSSAFDLSITGAGTTTLSAAQTWSVTGTGNTTFGKTIANGGNRLTLEATSTGTGTLTGAISGTGGLTKSGSGTWSLDVNNTYSGTTTVDGGVLRLNTATALTGGIGNGGGTANLTITGGGVIGLGFNDFERRVGTNANRVQFTGSGGFAAYGADRNVNFRANAELVTWDAGGFVPAGSALILGAADADKTVTLQNFIALAGAVRTVQADNGTADVDGVLSGVLSGIGASGLTKTGTGALALTNSGNTYEGITTVSAGTLSVGAAAPSGSAGALGNTTSAVVLGDAATTTNNSSASLLIGGAFNVGRDITIANQATAGTYTLGGNTAANSTFSGAIALNKNLTVTAVTGGTVNLTKSIANASGTNTVTITGAGTSNVVLNNVATNQFAPTLFSVTSGKLSLGASAQIADATNLTVVGGSLAMGNFDDTVGTVSLTGGSITGSGGTLTGSSYAVQSGSISAKLGGAGIGLTKTTGGTVSLSAANTYTGATTIQAGTLQLLTGGSLASLSIIVGDTGSVGAALDALASGLLVASGQTVSGIGTINGNTTIQLGGVIAPGNSPGILTNLGNMTLASDSNFQAEINGTTVGTGYDQLNVTGVVTLAGLLNVTTGFTPTVGSLFFLIDNDGPSAISGVFSNAPINGNTYTFGSQQYAVSYFGNYDTTNFTGGNDVVLMAVPEPSAALLGGVGMLCLLRRRRNA